MRHLFLVLASATCFANAAHSASAAPAAHTLYRVTVLNSGRSSATSVDDLGLVSGSYVLPDKSRHAALWAFGNQYDLGTLGSGVGLNSRVQWPVKNNVGLISGISLTDDPDLRKEGWSCGFFLANPNSHACRGFIWDPLHGMRELPTLGGTNGFATGTNDIAQTAGWAETIEHDDSCIAPQYYQFKPVVWGPRPNQIRTLPLLGKDTSGAATAINDQGQVVGISGDCGFAVGATTAKHAVFWEKGTATEIVNPNGAQYWNTPMMINERGEVVGFAGVPNDPDGNLTPPFFWSRQQGFKFIPMLPGDIAGVAGSINSHRQVVGYSNDANGAFHAWIWEDGKTSNLDDLIDRDPMNPVHVSSAYDINDLGEISGTTTGGQAFVAIPERRR